MQFAGYRVCRRTHSESRSLASSVRRRPELLVLGAAIQLLTDGAKSSLTWSGPFDATHRVTTTSACTQCSDTAHFQHTHPALTTGYRKKPVRVRSLVTIVTAHIMRDVKRSMFASAMIISVDSTYVPPVPHLQPRAFP